MTQLRIDGRVIDGSHPPYVIAELSANHQGSVNAAIELIHAAHEAGADAVKFQHFTAESITVRSRSRTTTLVSAVPPLAGRTRVRS